MATTSTRLTIDDVEALPEEHPGDRHELIDGELFVTPVPALKHQVVSGRLYRYLDRYVEKAGLGMVFAAPAGLRLDGDTLLIPDLFFVGRERNVDLNALTFDEAPDLVIEILSPGTRRRDLTTKRELYARFGVKEYWIVSPDAKTVTVLALIGDSYVQVPNGDDGALASRALPGLELTVGRLFDGVP